MVAALCALAGAAAQVGETQPAKLPWPEQCFVNGYPIMETRPWLQPGAWRKPTWVLDFSAKGGATNRGLRAAVERALPALRNRPGWQVGPAAMSANTVLPRALIEFHPANIIAVEDMPADAAYAGSWPGTPERRMIDVTHVPTSAALARLIGDHFAGHRVGFVDNALRHPGVARGAPPWTAQCAHVRRIREEADRRGTVLFFNIAGHPGQWTAAETDELVAALGRRHGITLETPLHPAFNTDAGRAAAAATYRRLLDADIGVLMLPLGVDAEQLWAWVKSWRRPTDPVWIQWNWLEPPPRWL